MHSIFGTIMNLEREEFLKVDTSFSNKANGYYPRMVRESVEKQTLYATRGCVVILPFR